MTEIAYKPLSVAEQIFKTLVWDVGIRAGELALEGAVPFFALPGVSMVEEGVINALSDWLYHQLVLLVDVEAIKLVNTLHQSAYERASLDLKIIAIDKGIDSDEFKKARDEARIALSQFTQFGGR